MFLVPRLVPFTSPRWADYRAFGRNDLLIVQTRVVGWARCADQVHETPGLLELCPSRESLRPCLSTLPGTLVHSFLKHVPVPLSELY